MELIYIGDKFYFESKTFMSSIYDVHGNRQNWNFVQRALKSGDYIHIRQATEQEMIFYKSKLKEIKEG